ncbi:MAG TPA: galactosyltransferase-related protein [Thermoanaerobaculia bacterium]|nr:galactosyltransferase-related protein [Thermoanaerobaculia bacterium]
MVALVRIRRDRPLPHALADFRYFHEGATIVVCGCGTSLSSFTQPERFITIGVNDVGRLFDPDYLVVLNPRQQFRGDRFRYVEESRAGALFTQLVLGVQHPHIVRFRLGRRGGVELDDPNVLHYTRNSPYVALQLAMHMGAKRIGLIGVDYTDDHFFGKSGRHPLARELPQIDAEYKRLYAAAQRRGVEIFNLSAASRVTAFPKATIEELERLDRGADPLRLVSYSTSPVAGVAPVLARAIASSTPHECRAVWATNDYGNGVSFTGDVEYTRRPDEARALLEAADAVILHNGKVDPRHAALLAGKPAVTLAHNYLWNVDHRRVDAGEPGLVVAQYQATLPEFAGWTPVPNPIPLWEPEYQPEAKGDVVTISYTPFGKYERFPRDHRLYWHSKGYHSTLRTLERLAARLPLRLEVIRNRQVRHADSLAMKRRSHIVIDECVTGSYHRNSLEGLAAGCVVVNGVGLLPGVTDVLRDVSGSEVVPFVRASLDDLERILEELIARGPEALADDGRRNRAWMKAHWDFGTQWTRFWEPAVAGAMSRATQRPAQPRVVPRPAAPVPTPVRTEPADVTVVIPFGGVERLLNLEATLDAIKDAGVREAIVVEMDAAPHARAAVEARGFRHHFIAAEEFHKARAMNEGAALVTADRFLWLDADLLVRRAFLDAAVAELDARSLDVLVPWTTIRFLREHDSAAVLRHERDPWSLAPGATHVSRRSGRGGAVLVRTAFVRQYGGIPEEFRGWGGEDDAWFAKASLLGSAGITSRDDQHAVHLHHPRCAADDRRGAMASNRNYRRNVALLRELRALATREQFLERFPPPLPPDPPKHAPARLNLGWMNGACAGYRNAARIAAPGVDEVVDLAAPWPWPDDAFDEIRAWHVVPHLADKLQTMNELWRVLRPGASAELVVPTTEGEGAFADPTNVSYWNRRTFHWFEDGNTMREQHAGAYGIRAKFRVLEENVDATESGPQLKIVLQAVKP